MQSFKKTLKEILPFVFILIAGYIIVKPLTISGFYPMHDDTQVARVFEMGKSLMDGLFPVRWVNDLGYGYGYPIFNFYAPFAYYIGAFFYLVGNSALDGTKIMIGIGIISAGFSMYLLSKSFFGKFGGIFAAICYLYAPYHALDAYVRGDIAEIYAYAFFPLALFGLWKTFKTKSKKYAVLSALGFACIIISHNLTALMLFPLFIGLGVAFFFLQKKETLFKKLLPLLSLFLGMLVSAFYWIPVFFEMRFTNVLSQVGGGADFHNHFVCLSQLWYSPWGFGGSAPGCHDGIAFALGKIYIAIVLVSILALPVFYRVKKETGIIVSISILCLFLSLFMVLQISEVLWNSIPVLAFLQYPWRFLLPAFFFISFLGGSIVFLLQQYIMQRKFLFAIVFLFCFSVIVLEWRYFIPQYNYPATDKDFTAEETLNWKTSKISDEYMPKDFKKPTNVTQIPQDIVDTFDGRTAVTVDKTQEKDIQIQTDKTQNLPLNIAYFPAWQAFVDGKQTKLSQTPTGMILNVPKGLHNLKLIFKSSPAEIFGNTLSVIGIILIILAIIV